MVKHFQYLFQFLQINMLILVYSLLSNKNYKQAEQNHTIIQNKMQAYGLEHTHIHTQTQNQF